MISAFGIDHGGSISKLGPAKVHGSQIQNVSDNMRHPNKKHSQELNVKYRGKSSILRRPTYEATVTPKGGIKGKPGDIIGSQHVTLNRKNRKAIVSRYQSNKKGNITLHHRGQEWSGGFVKKNAGAQYAN